MRSCLSALVLCKTPMIFQKENERNLDIQSFVSAFVICKRFFSEGKHEEFYVCPRVKPFQGTRADTKLRIHMVIFERPVLSLCNPMKYYDYCTVHNFIISLMLVHWLHMIGVRRFNLEINCIS